MKYIFIMLYLSTSIFTNCTSLHGITNIEPKNGTIEIASNGEFRMWRNVKHGGFTVMLNNSSPTQSVEIYKVNSYGNEKWIKPSLLANSHREITIPPDGYLLIKNYNYNSFSITYKIAE